MDNLSSKEIKEFIKYTYKKYCEYQRSEFLDNTIDEKFNSLIRCYGPVKALYINNDAFIFSLIKKKCNYSELTDLINIFCMETNNFTISMYKDCGISYEDAINKYGYKEIAFTSNDDPISFVNKIDYLVLDELKNEKKDVKETFLYLFFSYKYKERNLDQENIHKLYNDLDYGLITLNNNRNIMYKHNHICSFPRIYDTTLDKTIFILITTSLLNLFMLLYKEKMIKSLSFRGKNHMIFSGKNDREIILESKDTGKLFSYKIDNLPKVTQMSNCNYRNKLVVVHKDNDLYFEEINDKSVNNNDFIETQIVHFKFNTNRNIVTHLDHEYVYYSKEEFYDKGHILDKKGTYKERYKTFKLDECSIPIDLMCTSHTIMNKDTLEIKIPFIFYVLNECFEREDLLHEYFDSILSK